MKTLITGSNGLVGSSLKEFLDENTILTPTQEEFDITNLSLMKKYLNEVKTDVSVIVNYAAFTDVSAAELQRDDVNGLAWKINYLGVKNLIEICKQNGIFLIQISTDGVFSGEKSNPGPYKEDTKIETDKSKVSWYGWTKVMAENVIREEYNNSAIVRISNPVRVKFDGKLDYVHKIVDLYENDKLYPFFEDQFLTLTYIEEVSEFIKQLLSYNRMGVYHVSSTNIFTPFNLVSHLLNNILKKDVKIDQTSLSEYLKNNKARYPQYGGLDTTYTREIFKINFRKWEEILEDIYNKGGFNLPQQ